MIRKHKLGKFAVLGTAVACAVFVLAVGATSFASPPRQAGSSDPHGEDPGRDDDDRRGCRRRTELHLPDDGSAPTSAFPNFQLIYMLFRPLYWFGLGSTPNLNPNLSLANAPVYSNSGRTVTINLKNYKWSNGQAVTPRDVLFWMNMLEGERHLLGWLRPWAWPVPR